MGPSSEDAWKYQRHSTFGAVPHGHGSRDFHPFQAVAEAVNNAHSLRKIIVGVDGETVPRDYSGPTALANALRKHNSLEGSIWVDWCPLLEAAQITALDPVLQALSRGSFGLIGVLCWRQHKALFFILCSKHYQLVPNYSKLSSCPNVVVLKPSEIYSSCRRTQTCVLHCLRTTG
jgi:hypothetical protein